MKLNPRKTVQSYVARIKTKVHCLMEHLQMLLKSSLKIKVMEDHWNPAACRLDGLIISNDHSIIFLL